MKKFISSAVIAFSMLLVLPFVAYGNAEDRTANVEIAILDQQSQPTLGNWRLRRGGENGMIVRNGISSDEFKVEPGYYYLQLINTSDYNAYELLDEVVQFVGDHETISYTAYYYEDDEAMAIGPQTPLSSEEADPENSEPTEEEEEESEEEGEEEENEEEAEESEEEQEVTGTHIPDFNTAPRPFVPDFETAPMTSSDSSDDDNDIEIGAAGGGDLSDVPQLAATGLPMVGLLLPSVLGSLYLTRRRRD